MFLFNNIFSLRHLWLRFLPQKVLLFSIPLGLFVHLFLGKETWIFFWLFLLVLISTEMMKYKKCEKKHEELIEEYGDRYINLLQLEIEKVGLEELIDRYWVGLEPK